MIASENTKLMARFHPEQNNRGLSIYNPYFEDVGLDAVYLLFHNPDPAVLLHGMRDLAVTGAVVAGSFEKDPRLPSLLDSVHPISERLGTVGMVANKDGQLWGLYQGGYGLFDSINELAGGLQGRSVTIMGAGNVTRALLAVMEERSCLPDGVTIFNRTPQRAEIVGSEFSSIVTKVGSLADLQASEGGDLLINASQIGAAWTTDPGFTYTEDLVSRFSAIGDVAFVPLKPELVRIAEALGLPVAPGHAMFRHQAKRVLQECLSHEMVPAPFEARMLHDFRTNWS